MVKGVLLQENNLIHYFSTFTLMLLMYELCIYVLILCFHKSLLYTTDCPISYMFHLKVNLIIHQFTGFCIHSTMEIHIMLRISKHHTLLCFVTHGFPWPDLILLGHWLTGGILIMSEARTQNRERRRYDNSDNVNDVWLCAYVA